MGKKILPMAIIIFSFFLPGLCQSNEEPEQSGARKVLDIINRCTEAEAKAQWGDMQDDRNYRFDPKEFLEIGANLRSSGQVAKAVRFLGAAVEFLPHSSELWQNLGYAYIRLLRRDEAVDCYTRALALDPRNWRAKEQLDLIDISLREAKNETRAVMKYKPGTNTGLLGPYLGQQPPGVKPELFAPGIVSVYGSNENTVTLTADGREIYFGKEAGIWVCVLTDNGWTAPENTGLKGYEMWIAPTSNKMYYSGWESGIWVMERSDNGWMEPILLVKNGMFSTLTRDETLYTTIFKNGANIGRYRKQGDLYTEPEIFGLEINTPQSFDAHPNVAPDESFLIFDSNRPGGKGLYITFQKKDGSWTQAEFLGKELAGSVSTFSPDGKYLFFMKNRDIYWVDAKVIKEKRPKELE